jgi:hypothetical protein
MFYSHLLALPGFLFVAPDIVSHFQLWLNEPPISIASPIGQFNVSLFTLLALNLLFQ